MYGVKSKLNGIPFVVTWILHSHVIYIPNKHYRNRTVSDVFHLSARRTYVSNENEETSLEYSIRIRTPFTQIFVFVFFFFCKCVYGTRICGADTWNVTHDNQTSTCLFVTFRFIWSEIERKQKGWHVEGWRLQSTFRNDSYNNHNKMKSKRGSIHLILVTYLCIWSNEITIAIAIDIDFWRSYRQSKP